MTVHAIEPHDAGYTQILCVESPVGAWIPSAAPDVFITPDMAHSFSPRIKSVTCPDCISKRVTRRSQYVLEAVYRFLASGPGTYKQMLEHFQRDQRMRDYELTPAMLRMFLRDYVEHGQLVAEMRAVGVPPSSFVVAWYRLP